MARHVCPWWIGYLLASPLRRILQNPETILAPHVREGMTVMDIGPGMGFFTIPAAGMVGDGGSVIAVDVQERMLQSLEARARKAGVANRVRTMAGDASSMTITETVDLCLAINVFHEVPDPARFATQIKKILKPTGKLLLVEPKGHVPEKDFQETLALLTATGLKIVGRPTIRRSRTALFES